MIKGDVLLNDIDKMIERDIAWGVGRGRHCWDCKNTNEKSDDPFMRLFHYCFKLTVRLQCLSCQIDTDAINNSGFNFNLITL